MRKILTLCGMVGLAWSLTANAAQKAGPKEFAGTWVLRLGERNLFVLTLTLDGARLYGTFERPSRLSSNIYLFSAIGGEVRHDKVVRSSIFDGVLNLTVQNANDAKDEQSYVMVLKADRAELAIERLPPQVVVEPYLLERVPSGAKVATDWEANRAYAAGDSDIPSTEMKKIFDEDQHARQGEHVDWDSVTRADAERRNQTRTPLSTGTLHTGKDYEEAAFVFQHGDSPQDYLLAHTLAMVAVSKGDSIAIWIAAATLDRYLQKSGQKQIFGTQYVSDPAGNWTQDPYDRELIADALRRQLAVPPEATQAAQLKAYQDSK